MTAMSGDSYVGPLEQVPLDETPPLDSDLGDVKPGQAPEPDLIRRTVSAAAAPTTARKIVPFGRQLKFGMRGNDVRAIQRVMAREGIGGTLKGATGWFGVRTRSRVKKAQKLHGLPASGVYGLQLHAALASAFQPFDIFLYTGVNPNESPTHRARRLIVAACLALYAYGGHMHYTQSSRRMSVIRDRLRPPFEGHELYEDCSSSATVVYWLAGAADPNGRGYDLQGYTGTLWEHGKSVGLEQAQPGDLVFYKSPSWPSFPWAHVAVYLGGRRVFTFGSAPPRILDIDYRTGDYGRVGIRSNF